MISALLDESRMGRLYSDSRRTVIKVDESVSIGDVVDYWYEYSVYPLAGWPEGNGRL